MRMERINQAHAATFSARCMREGVNHRGCGLAAVEMAQAMLAEPFTPERVPDHKSRSGFALVLPSNGALGALIRHGLARFVVEAGHYITTPKGAAWLDALKQKGLI